MKHIELAKQKVFIITDIHGSYRHLTEMLAHVPDDVLILFLGDYIDRGEDSKRTVALVKDLVEKGRAIAIRGNHEEMLAHYLTNEHSRMLYHRNGGRTTIMDVIKPFLPSDATTLYQIDYKQERKLLLDHWNDAIEFLASLPLIVEMDEYLFVHAGILPEMKTLDEAVADDILWIREEFHDTPHQLPRKVFFGHTPVKSIDGGVHIKNGIWHDAAKSKFGLDGGCVFGNHLLGVLLDPFEQTLTINRVYSKYEYKQQESIHFEQIGTLNLT